MTKNERDQVVSFVDELAKRINEAKVAIRDCNYGTALNNSRKHTPYSNSKWTSIDILPRLKYGGFSGV